MHLFVVWHWITHEGFIRSEQLRRKFGGPSSFESKISYLPGVVVATVGKNSTHKYSQQVFEINCAKGKCTNIPFLLIHITKLTFTYQPLEILLRVSARHGCHHHGVLSLFNPLHAELNPICHLLALLGAHHIFHVSGLRVNVATSKWSVEE